MHGAVSPEGAGTTGDRDAILTGKAEAGNSLQFPPTGGFTPNSRNIHRQPSTRPDTVGLKNLDRWGTYRGNRTWMGYSPRDASKTNEWVAQTCKAQQPSAIRAESIAARAY
jgi:hypothetical protein